MNSQSPIDQIYESMNLQVIPQAANQNDFYNDSTGFIPNMKRAVFRSTFRGTQTQSTPWLATTQRQLPFSQQQTSEFSTTGSLFPTARVKNSQSGSLRKAKIAKNLFDDPAAAASAEKNASIELFLMRKKNLGRTEVPPPGHYFDEAKQTTFKLKKSSSAQIHFDSTAQRTMNFGASIFSASKQNGNFAAGQEIPDHSAVAITSGGSSIGTDPMPSSEQKSAFTESIFERKKRRYYASLKNINPNTHPEIFTSQTEQLGTLDPSSQAVALTDSKFYGQSSQQQDSMMKTMQASKFTTTRGRSSNSSKMHSTFSKAVKQPLFVTNINTPGPGMYPPKITAFKEKTRFRNQNIYFAAFFGSGTKRFQ